MSINEKGIASYHATILGVQATITATLITTVTITIVDLLYLAITEVGPTQTVVGITTRITIVTARPKSVKRATCPTNPWRLQKIIIITTP